MKNIDSVEFHAKFVNPFYGGLMGFNLLKEEIVPNPAEFIQSVIALKDNLSDSELREMLKNKNWRPAKVGAWIIGLCQLYELEEDLTISLKERPNHCEHTLINLTLLNTSEARKSIHTFIENQLIKILELTTNGKEFHAFDTFEKNSVIWGFYALKYFDSVDSTNSFADILVSHDWLTLKKKWSEISKTNPRAIVFYNELIASESRDLGFTQSIERIKQEMKTF